MFRRCYVSALLPAGPCLNLQFRIYHENPLFSNLCLIPTNISLSEEELSV
jgi:hypothetical protein